MDAPVYPPASEYIAPEMIPGPLNTRTSSLAELLANPKARAIMFSEAPPLEQTLTSEQIQPHLGNLSLRSLLDFGAVDQAAIERIDARFKAVSGENGR